MKLYVAGGQAYYYRELAWPDLVKLEDIENDNL